MTMGRLRIIQIRPLLRMNTKALSKTATLHDLSHKTVLYLIANNADFNRASGLRQDERLLSEVPDTLLPFQKTIVLFQ